jgi:MFS transporter, FLVCR family, MFS-domain-containing protein 7
VENSLRAGPDADPPFNMHRALIFEGAFTLAVSATMVGLRGKQARRERDEQEIKGELNLGDRLPPYSAAGL